MSFPGKARLPIELIASNLIFCGKPMKLGTKRRESSRGVMNMVEANRMAIQLIKIVIFLLLSFLPLKTKGNPPDSGIVLKLIRC